MFGWLLKQAQRRGLVPAMSATEREALEAGDVWIDGDLFSGRPDLKRLLAEPWPELTPEERAFLEGPVEALCARVDDRELWRTRELPEEIWSTLRRDGFFGLAIPREWGGLGFSALGCSTVYGKLASRSLALSAIVLIPNSVGPGELLLAYGTEDQRRRWLPRLARGEEIPCFALTEPEAGSDAAALSSTGRVVRRADGSTGLVLDFEKRYITLAPVATLIGLAVGLEDPEEILGRGPRPGITVVLVPAATEGVEIGCHHDPMGVPFPNGPIRGHGVEVGLDAIPGGAEGAGRGWRMLMEALSGGRAVSLPAQSAGGAKTVARRVGAYASVRRQFGLPIARFEGVAEPLGRIAGRTYWMEAVRVATCGAVDSGKRPAVVSALVKVSETEAMRRVIRDAMDIAGGAGLCLGPRNLFARGYAGAPIGITVEGANILTRTLIVFGQGVVRSHPWAGSLLAALRNRDPAGLRRAAWGFTRHLAGTAARTALLDLTRARLARRPVDGPLSLSARRLAWASARFALLSDLALVAAGPALKRRGRLSGRFADALAGQTIALATLRRFEAEGRQEEDLPLARYAIEEALANVQEAFEGIVRNFPRGALRTLLRGPVAWLWRSSPVGRPPADGLGDRAAALLCRPGPARDRLTAWVYEPSDPDDPGAQLEEAFRRVDATRTSRARIRSAQRDGSLPRGEPERRVRQAVATGVVSEEEGRALEACHEARLRVLAADEFDPEVYRGAAPVREPAPVG